MYTLDYLSYFPMPPYFAEHLPPLHPHITNTSPATGWSNWPIDKVHISKLICRQIFPCQYISTHSISIDSMWLHYGYLLSIQINSCRLYSFNFITYLNIPSWQLQLNLITRLIIEKLVLALEQISLNLKFKEIILWRKFNNNFKI